MHRGIIAIVVVGGVEWVVNHCHVFMGIKRCHVADGRGTRRPTERGKIGRSHLQVQVWIMTVLVGAGQRLCHVRNLTEHVAVLIRLVIIRPPPSGILRVLLMEDQRTVLALPPVSRLKTVPFFVTAALDHEQCYKDTAEQKDDQEDKKP